jgi:hypothetical protein
VVGLFSDCTSLKNEPCLDIPWLFNLAAPGRTTDVCYTCRVIRMGNPVGVRTEHYECLHDYPRSSHPTVGHLQSRSSSFNASLISRCKSISPPSSKPSLLSSTLHCCLWLSFLCTRGSRAVIRSFGANSCQLRGVSPDINLSQNQ